MQTTSFGPTTSFLGVVKNKPFQTDLEHTIIQKLPDGQLQKYSLAGKICRDSSGRRRQEVYLKTEDNLSVNLITIQDPIAQTISVLDVNNMVASVERFQISNDRGSALSPESRSIDRAEIAKEIEGQICYRFQTRLPDGSKLEAWFSPELKETLLENISSATEEKIMRLYNIRQVEPDPELFVIPKTYQIVRQ